MVRKVCGSIEEGSLVTAVLNDHRPSNQPNGTSLLFQAMLCTILPKNVIDKADYFAVIADFDPILNNLKVINVHIQKGRGIVLFVRI